MMTASAASPVTSGKTVVAAVSVNVAASIMTALVGLGATAFLARIVPVEQFGRIVLLLTLITAFAIFEGQRPVVIHRVAADIGGPGSLFHAAARINLLMVGVAIAFFLGGLALGAGGGLSAPSDVVIGLTIVAFFVAMQYWTFLDAEQQTVFTGIARSLAWILLYLGFCAVAWWGLDLFYYTVVLLLMHLALLAMLIARFYHLGLAAKYSRKNWGEDGPSLLGPALSNIVFNGCAVTMNVADRAIVGSVLGVSAAGFYSGPSELALRALGLVRAGVQVILPWAARLSPSHQQRYWLIAIAGILVIVGSGAAILLLLRHEITALLLGEKFRPYGDLLGIFGIGIVMATLSYACIVQLNARGDFATQRSLYIVGTIILLSGAFMGARAGSLLGVSLAFLVARSVDLVLLALLLRACSLAARGWFFCLSTSVLIALVAAWEHMVIVTFASLMLSYGVALFFWYRFGRRNLDFAFDP